MNNTIEKFLDIARAEIGKGEEGQNNAGPHVEKYLNRLIEPPANWCAAFVSWCIREALIKTGNPAPSKYFLSARAMWNAVPKSQRVEVPQPGDLIFFWRESPSSWMGHVGIVEEVVQKFPGVDSIIRTIEGNKGKFPAKVARYEYTSSVPKLIGYARIF